MSNSSRSPGSDTGQHNHEFTREFRNAPPAAKGILSQEGPKSVPKGPVKILVPEAEEKPERPALAGRDEPRRETRRTPASQAWWAKRGAGAAQVEGDDANDWLTTYSDAITLLMAFFVVLISIAEVKEEQFEEVRAGIVQAFGGESPKSDVLQGGEAARFSKVLSTLEKTLTQLVNDGTMKVHNSDRGIQMEFNSNAMYRAGSAEILPGIKPTLRSIAKRIKDLQKNRIPVVVEIEGHTDDVPINTPKYPSNWELSVNRATNIIRFFLSQGLKGTNMKAAGYADTKPKVPTRDRAGRGSPKNRAKNRRIVIKIERYG